MNSLRYELRHGGAATHIRMQGSFGKTAGQGLWPLKQYVMSHHVAVLVVIFLLQRVTICFQICESVASLKIRIVATAQRRSAR